MGYLKPLGEKRFRIVYDLPLQNGKRKQKTETLENTTKKAAHATLAAREATVSKGLYSGDETTTFGDFFVTFMKKKREAQKPRAATTLQAYESLYSTYLEPSFGSTRVSKISSQQIEAALQSWRAGRVTKNASWKTADRECPHSPPRLRPAAKCSERGRPVEDRRAECCLARRSR